MNSGEVPSASAVNRNARSPVQAKSFTDTSYRAVALVGLPASVPSGLQSAMRMSHLSASYPGFFCARHASLLPSGENLGPPSAALLSAVSASHLVEVFVTETRQRS